MELNEDDVQRVLPVKMTPDERDEMGRKLSQAWDDYELIEDDKKKATGCFTKQLREKRAEISKFSRLLKTGHDLRVVRCRWIEDFKHNVKRLVRQDSGDVVEEIALTAEERQTRIDGMDA